MGAIAYQNKDIASKLTAELLVGNHLGPFGLPEKKVVGLLPTPSFYRHTADINIRHDLLQDECNEGDNEDAKRQ